MQRFLMEEDNKDEWSLAPSIVSLNEFVGINYLVEEFMMMRQVFPSCVIAKGDNYRLKSKPGIFFKSHRTSSTNEACLIVNINKRGQ